MAGGRNGEELGDALDHAEEQDSNPIWHGLVRRENGAKDKKENCGGSVGDTGNCSLDNPGRPCGHGRKRQVPAATCDKQLFFLDRKSTRLNSSHMSISYAVFCLKKKKKKKKNQT